MNANGTHNIILFPWYKRQSNIHKVVYDKTYLAVYQETINYLHTTYLYRQYLGE